MTLYYRPPVGPHVPPTLGAMNLASYTAGPRYVHIAIEPIVGSISTHAAGPRRHHRR